MNDPVREYCRKKEYADHVIHGGIRYLVEFWDVQKNSPLSFLKKVNKRLKSNFCRLAAYLNKRDGADRDKQAVRVKLGGTRRLVARG